jgi:signal transduction histidine kinase/ligand-binding sensor domain-containing protein
MQRKLTVLACLVLCANCFAQQYPFVYYTPRDGLVNSRVRSIKQDSRGRMYFITYSGLSVYDGTRFNNYHRADGLADELINDLVEITPDSVLVATNTNKLNTLVKGKIGLFKTRDGFCPVINRFIKTSEGQWYVTADDGLFIFSDDHFTRIPLISNQGKDVGKYLDRVTEWRNFLFIIPWDINDKGRMILFDKNSHRVTDVDTREEIYAVTVDHNGHVWINTGTEMKWMDEAALQKGMIALTDLPRGYKKAISNKTGLLLFDNDNNCMLYGGNSILRISPSYQVQTISVAQGLKIADALEMFEDREGLLWIATNGNGVIKWKGTETQLINTLSNKPSMITALCNQGDTTWFYNRGDETVRYIYKNESGHYHLGIRNFNAFNIFVDRQKLYLADAERVLCIRDNHKVAAYQHPEFASHDIKDSFSFGHAVMDPYGAIIFYRQRNDGPFTLSVFKDKKILAQYPVSYVVDQLIIDHAGRLWVITRNNNLMLFTLHPESPGQYLQLVKDYASAIRELGVRSIAEDNENNIWLGTRYNGLYRLQFNKLKLASVKQFTRQDGLTDNFVYSIKCDENNTLWIGTQNGLDKMFSRDQHYIIGNTGRINDLFQTVQKIVVTNNNTVWALTMEGSLISVRSNDRKATFIPQLSFTSFFVNESQRMDSSSEFPYSQNNLSFSVAAPSFVDEKSIVYSHILQGSSHPTWSKPSNNSTFSFINLAPGHYKLIVRADFPEGIYPSQILSRSFNILPPWWQTWWFRIGASALLIGMLVIATRFYYRRKLDKQRMILEKKQAIEKERTRIATDMHDDLGAGLSRIKFLSETIGLKKQQQQPIEEEITKIREYSHEMIDKMGEIVWALNERHDSLSDLLSYTRSYAMEYLSQNGIACRINTPENSKTVFVSGEFRRNIFLSVKEALHNVVKHAQADEVIVNVSVDKYLTISLQDNGVGINKESIRPYSNGLNNIKKRMEEIHGVADIENKMGTTVTLKAAL